MLIFESYYQELLHVISLFGIIKQVQFIFLNFMGKTTHKVSIQCLIWSRGLSVYFTLIIDS